VLRNNEHPYVRKLRVLFAEGRCDRREFLRTATLLGVSASAAYAFIGTVTGKHLATPAAAAVRQGGSVRASARVREIPNPHAISNAPASNLLRQTVEYLSKTGADNVTRPYLLERWTPSEDLKTWTLHVRRNVKWRSGRPFTADDVVWNLKRVLDPSVGSSVLGLMKGYMLDEYETGERDDKGNPKRATRLWDASAIQKVDDLTVRLNLKAPQLAVPEHLFHYPLVMLDPDGAGKFGPRMNGTGPFELVEYEVSKRAVFRAHKGYWSEGPHLDEVVFVDLGDEPGAEIAALASRQVSAIPIAQPTQLATLKRLPGLQFHVVKTAATVIARMQPVSPFTDLRVVRAMRYSVDNDRVVELTFGEVGYRGEHHHVSPVQSDYAPLPPFKRDVAKAKQLLAEAGYANGIDVPVELTLPNLWHKDVAQVLVQQWAEAGIRVKLNVLPATEWYKVWDKVPFGLVDWSHRPLGVMLLALAYRTGVPWNDSRFSNAEFDRLLSQAESTVDVEKRRGIMRRLQAILQEDGPMVQPLFRSVFTFADSKLKGLQMHPGAYVSCHEWWLEA
jgi:peptide/nickel transport system substrate-binding protein